MENIFDEPISIQNFRASSYRSINKIFHLIGKFECFPQNEIDCGKIRFRTLHLEFSIATASFTAFRIISEKSNQKSRKSTKIGTIFGKVPVNFDRLPVELGVNLLKNNRTHYDLQQVRLLEGLFLVALKSIRYDFLYKRYVAYRQIKNLEPISRKKK